MKFWESVFHCCEFKPLKFEQIKGYKRVSFYNPQGMDADYYEIYTKDKMYTMSFKPETKKLLISKCVCGNENCSNGL